MKITRSMVDNELQSMMGPMSLLAFILSHRWGVKLMRLGDRLSQGASSKDLHSDERWIPSRSGGPDIRIRIFKPHDASGPLPGMLYLHGGGYMIGAPEAFLSTYEKFIAAAPCVIVAPDYRKSIDAPYPAGFDDAYDTLVWMQDNAADMGIIPDKFIVGGHSAGGGLTAAVSLKARDTDEVSVAFQMPVYPMIDDRQDTPSAVDNNAPVWNAKTNALGWSLYLHDLIAAGADIPAYAAPARAEDYANLPPTITFVGALEPFHDETVAYVEHLRAADVPVDFEVFKGCYHGFEGIATKAGVSQAAWGFLLGAYQDYIDAYM